LYIKKKIILNNKELSIETGRIAKNTTASILANIDGTTLLVTIVHKKSEEKDFLPLKIDYFERYYANGKIPCNYFRREGRPNEREILISRLIDRSIRPLFPKDFGYEIQITVMAVSINPEINPDIIAINATSIALSISGLSFYKPIVALKIGYSNNSFIINPSTSDLEKSDLNLIISGTMDEILMIESECDNLPEDILIQAISIGHKNLASIINEINEFKNEVNNTNLLESKVNNNEFYNIIYKKFKTDFCIAHNLTDSKKKQDAINDINTNIIEYCTSEKLDIKESHIKNVVNNIEKEILRDKILETSKHLDNRSNKDVRDILIDIDLLKNAHGSALFTRGQTQSLAVTTLGTDKNSQSIDCVFHENNKNNFILHYNFLPYSVNEIGHINMVKRREIGHGHLAKKALKPVLPKKADFPYVIRIVSEITESNGSSSMATVCSSSLSLMVTGVPIKNHVAGIAMGLIKKDDKYVILSDITGEEDSIGDMDFKIAGTRDGITALQMDVKSLGITDNIIKEIIYQGKDNRLHILDIMEKTISKPNDKLSMNVPKLEKIKINKAKIKDIIGKGGSTIKYLTEKYNSKIDIDDDGTIIISSSSSKNIESLKNEIQTLTKEITVGNIFKGKVIKLVQFGAFVNILPKKDGLLHISKINKYKINYPDWEIKEGITVDVIVSKIDNTGKISLNLT